MSGFVVIAALLTLAALAGLLYPLLRRREGSPEAWRSGGIAALIVVAAAAALYPLWSNFRWHEPEQAADSPAAMVGRLARRLEKNPDDLDGWLQLGRSYGVLEQFPLAVRAYQRADTLAKGQSAEAKMGLAEALANAGRSDLAGHSGRLFEEALELDPNSVRALFFSALAAAERHEPALARARFARLLEANPPPEVRPLIEEQIAALDDAMTTKAAVTVPLRVTLAPGVAGNAVADAPLFVAARIPGQQRGPPLAAKKLEAKFPQDVELFSTDAMIAGSGFAAGQELEIEARIANGGSAGSQTGDPFGVARVTAGTDRRIVIEINQLKP